MIAVPALGIAAWSILVSRSLGPSEMSHLSIQLSPPLAMGRVSHALALSPDGRNLIYVGEEETSHAARTIGGVGKLYNRRLGELESRTIPGTERATAPIFSPDGKFLAFWSEGLIATSGIFRAQ